MNAPIGVDENDGRRIVVPLENINGRLKPHSRS
jgi:hypothetical protein